MLRIQRHAATREITLTMRSDKHTWLVRDMWIALSIAIALHAFALVLFRFPIVKLRYVQSPQTAVVYTDPGSAGPTTTAHVIERASKQLLPEGLLPALSAQPKPGAWQIDRLECCAGHSLPLAVTFSQLENERVRPFEVQNTLSPSGTKMNFIVSGPASAHLKQLPPTTFRDICPECALCFDIRVDGKTGKIAWWTLTTPAVDNALQKIAEDAMVGMVFQEDKRQVIIPGVVEIYFSHLVEERP